MKNKAQRVLQLLEIAPILKVWLYVKNGKVKEWTNLAKHHYEPEQFPLGWTPEFEDLMWKNPEALYHIAYNRGFIRINFTYPSFVEIEYNKIDSQSVQAVQNYLEKRLPGASKIIWHIVEPGGWKETGRKQGKIYHFDSPFNMYVPGKSKTRFFR